ncbi:MAG TPA: prepilin-type N-terminal cleavage/methylation domain-containing protein [Verrucomicrobiae bacterium]|nr:prepilin-type N-terminal cleavage/methylation domain-containing protein [Verrucomicrobiae bacterium]
MKNSSRGFTLVEILIVFALVATFAALAVAGFSRFYNERLPRLYVKDLAGYVRYLQFKAIEDGKIYRMTVDNDTGVSTASKPNAKKDFEPLRDALSRRFQKKGEFAVVLGEGHEVYFFPDGTVTRNAVTVSRNGGEIATLQIKNRLGALEIHYAS